MSADHAAGVALAATPAFFGLPQGPSWWAIGAIAADLLCADGHAAAVDVRALAVARCLPALEHTDLTTAALHEAVGPDAAVVIRLLSLRVRSVDGATKDAAVAGGQFWRAPLWGQLGLVAHRVATAAVADLLDLNVAETLASERGMLGEALARGAPGPAWPAGWAEALRALVVAPAVLARGDAGSVSSACHALATASILAPRRT